MLQKRRIEIRPRRQISADRIERAYLHLRVPRQDLQGRQIELRLGEGAGDALRGDHLPQRLYGGGAGTLFRMHRQFADLKTLDANIRQQLAPVAAKPFVAFHDGYSYFVERYGLNQVGELTVHPEQRPGAASVRALREMIAAKGVGCAFAEPQFDPATLQVLAGDTQMKIGTLDAIGANLPPGPDLYPSLLQQNARAIESCLSSTS